MILDNKVPEGPLESKWTKYKSSVPLVSPANKRKLDIMGQTILDIRIQLNQN